LLAALEEATVGRPLALLPVALRNIVVIFTPALPPTREIFCVRHGLFAGRLVLGERTNDWRELESFLTRCYAAVDPASRSAEVVIDELRLVAGWLHRTRARARWVHLDPRMHAMAAAEAVMSALPSRLISGF
jgi:hypothetical protein